MISLVKTYPNCC